MKIVNVYCLKLHSTVSMSLCNIMYNRDPHYSVFINHPVLGGGQDGINSIATRHGLEGLAFES